MADTDFTINTQQKKVWSREVWSIARNSSFAFQFMGTSENAMIHRITELTKTERGDQAIITLVPDLEDDGVMGDYDLEGNEEAIQAFDSQITIDQLRHANRSKGRMTEQKSIVKFRQTSRNVLGYWMGDRIDQMMFLTLSGVPYTLRNNGALRPVRPEGRNLSDLAFAGDITAPSSARHLRWTAAGTGDLVAGDVTAVTAADTPTYKMLVLAKAYAKEQYIKGIRGPGGQEIYHVFVTPTGMAKLKLDPDYMANVRHAWQRSEKNPLFAGTTSIMADGLVIHEYRHVFNTAGALTGTNEEAGDAGYKWGANANVAGQRILMCGAQAAGFADLGNPYWDEDQFDYKNKPGISIGKILGMLKPVFHSPINGSNQDFGVLCIDTAI
jgi:N4-gp56 family major capsid protein